MNFYFLRNVQFQRRCTAAAAVCSDVRVSINISEAYLRLKFSTVLN